MTNKPDISAKQGSTAAGLIIDSVVQTINIDGGSLSKEEAQQHENQYLQRIMNDCAGLEWLRLVGKEDENTPSMSLDSVYTALLTQSFAGKQADALEKEQREQRSLSALEVLNQHQYLVLTGTPGSGKSAFVNYLALCLAGENLADTRSNLHSLTEPLPDEDGNPQTQKVTIAGKKDQQTQQQRQPWDHQALIPVRIILRDFAASKQHFPASDEQADAQCLLAFIQDQLEKKSCADYTQLLTARLRSGEALVMFDGLDEVAQASERRKRLILCIHGFVKSFSTARYLVTCRPFAYIQNDWQLEGFATTSLADFSRGQIRRFIQRWYGNALEFDPEQAGKRSQTLQTVILQRDALFKLAKRPLLLSLIAYLHANRHDLPERRADLYERLLELLIDEWEKARFKTEDSAAALQCEQHSLVQYLRIGQDTIRLVLERLAFQAHARQSTASNAEIEADASDTADIAAKDLTHQLLCAAKAAGHDSIQVLEICEYLRDRVGILYQRGGDSELNAVYTFPHRSFQEYLAAAYFRRIEKSMFEPYPEQDDWQELAAYLGSSDPERWREVIILAGGIKAQKDPSPVWDLLNALYPEAVEQLNAQQAWGLRLAAEILAENLQHNELNRKQQRIFERIQQALPRVLNSTELPAVERVAVGKHLAVIGDPRAALMELDAMQFCHIAAGAFWMGKGSADQTGEEWLSETPAADYQLDYAYWLAQSPVTVAQYRQYVAESQQQPADADSLTGKRNEPVVSISWHEAMAFCRWLSQRWQAAGYLPQNWSVRLANEPEWEKAARGGLQTPNQLVIMPVSAICFAAESYSTLQDNPLPQRRYPWGDDLDNESLNYDMHIGHVSTPGAFPAGNSVYACEDLSANVWEWTRSQEGDYPYPKPGSKQWQQRETEGGDARRVLRGGAFSSSQGYVRAAVRGDSHPDGRSYSIGFRVCLSPFPLNAEPLDADALNE